MAITVYRADKDEYVDMSVTRRKIEVPTVEYSMLDDKSAGLQSRNLM